MLGPRRSNGIIETISVALSYEVLEALFKKFGSGAPYANRALSEFAPHFREYSEDAQRTALSRFPGEIQAAVKQGRWIVVRRYLQDHRAEQEQLNQEVIGSQRGRDIQSLGAIALRSGPIHWNEFIGLAGCTIPPPQKAPMFSDLPLTPACLKRLADPLCRIGIGCAPRK